MQPIPAAQGKKRGSWAGRLARARLAAAQRRMTPANLVAGEVLLATHGRRAAGPSI